MVMRIVLMRGEPEQDHRKHGGDDQRPSVRKHTISKVKIYMCYAKSITLAAEAQSTIEEKPTALSAFKTISQ